MGHSESDTMLPSTAHTAGTGVRGEFFLRTLQGPCFPGSHRPERRKPGYNVVSAPRESYTQGVIGTWAPNAVWEGGGSRGGWEVGKRAYEKLAINGEDVPFKTCL